QLPVQDGNDHADSAADTGAARRAEVRARRQIGAAFGAVLDRRGQRLAATHAELRARRVGRLTLSADDTGRRGRRCPALRPRPLRLLAVRWLLPVLTGWPRRRRCRLAAQHVSHAEAGGEERRLGAGAALRHALTGAQRHLARGVPLEPAGQLRVRRVLRELLELGLVLWLEVDVEVTHPGQLDPVRVELPVAGLDGGLL